MVHYCEKLMGVVVFAKVQGQVKFASPKTFVLLPLTLCSNNRAMIPAKNSKSCSFSTLLNHQNMVLDGNENSWMVMSTTPQIVWVVMNILGW